MQINHVSSNLPSTADRPSRLMKTLLTGKQSWRRQSAHEPDHFPLVDINHVDLSGNNSILGQFWTLTRGPQPKIDKTVIRKVRFQTSVRVILIPSRPEYIAAGLLPVLWWEKSDFPLFKTAAVSEVISIMQLRNIKNCKDAMRLLYQTDLRPESPETVFESDMEISDSDSTPRSLDDKMSDSSSVDNESPRSCLKQKFHEEKTVKRPISCLAKEERYNHVQRHLHPLAYMCD